MTSADQEAIARRCHAVWAAEQGTGTLADAVWTGKMVAASDALASAVAALLSEWEHVVEVGTAVTDPGCPQPGRGLALELDWARACLVKLWVGVCDGVGVSRFRLLSDGQWSLIGGLLPGRTGGRGRPFGDARLMVEGIIYRYRCGIAWRDLPAVFGLWQTVWRWYRPMAADGTWDEILGVLTAKADA